MIPVSELSNLLPHRDKMVWIDFVVEAKDQSGSCLVNVDQEKHYYGPDGLRQSVLIEWMAQGYGFICAETYRHQKADKKLEKAFLVAVDKMIFGEELPFAGDEVLIELSLVRVVGPVSYVEGKVINRKTGLIYAEGTIKLFSV